MHTRWSQSRFRRQPACLLLATLAVAWLMAGCGSAAQESTPVAYPAPVQPAGKSWRPNSRRACGKYGNRRSAAQPRCRDSARTSRTDLARIRARLGRQPALCNRHVRPTACARRQHLCGRQDTDRSRRPKPAVDPETVGSTSCARYTSEDEPALIHAIDTTTLEEVGTLPGRAIAVDSARNRLFVGEPFSSYQPSNGTSVRVVDGATLELVREIPQPRPSTIRCATNC